MLPARRPCPCPQAGGSVSGGGSSLSHNAESDVPDHGPPLHSALLLPGAQGQAGWSKDISERQQLGWVPDRKGTGAHSGSQGSPIPR